MKLDEKYISKINLQNLMSYNCWINPNVQDILQVDFYELSFINLYPNITLGLYELNLLESEKENVNKFVNIFNDYEKLKSDDSLFKHYRTIVNSFYGQMSTQSALKVTEYLKYYFEDILQKNSENILYYDVDTIFYKNEIDVLNTELPYKIEKVDFGVFFDRKRYTLVKSNKFINYPKTYKDGEKRISLKLREYNLNELLK